MSDYLLWPTFIMAISIFFICWCVVCLLPWHRCGTLCSSFIWRSVGQLEFPCNYAQSADANVTAIVGILTGHWTCTRQKFVKWNKSKWTLYSPQLLLDRCDGRPLSKLEIIYHCSSFLSSRNRGLLRCRCVLPVWVSSGEKRLSGELWGEAELGKQIQPLMFCLTSIHGEPHGKPPPSPPPPLRFSNEKSSWTVMRSRRRFNLRSRLYKHNNKSTAAWRSWHSEDWRDVGFLFFSFFLF